MGKGLLMTGLAFCAFLLWNRTRFCLPNFLGVFGDSSVAGKFPGRRHVQNRFLRPCVLIGIQLDQFLVRFEIGFQIRQVHIVIAVRQERVAQLIKNTRFVAAEVIGEN